MFSHNRFTFAALLVVVGGGLVSAQTPTSFPAAKHGKGVLAYVQGVPVLTVRGTPAEIGEQFGVLAVKNAPDLDGLHRRFLKELGLDQAELLLKVMARRLEPGVPADHLAEMTAAGKAAGRDLDLLLFANAAYDLNSTMGCSTVVVEKARSETGGPLLGRLFDWDPVTGIDDHTLVAVFHPVGKRSFATVTISPIAGCISGMNDAGLCCTLNQVRLKQSKDKAPFDWTGTPTMLAFRRVLEECGTVAEAEALLRGMKRTTTAGLTVCDPNGGAVFEITPKSLEVRQPVNGVTLCTNHFCSEELGRGDKCKRLDKLAQLQKQDAKLGVDAIFTELDGVHQGKMTWQAMVFEPAAKVLHLKLGDGKTSATKSKTIRLDLGKMF
jgi:isopenicillin-N N-acyltransferase like protein